MSLSKPTVADFHGVQAYLLQLYQHVSGLSNSWVLLDEQTASSSASLDFTGIDSTYDLYIFDIESIAPATDGAEFLIRISQDSGSTWKSGITDYEYVMVGRGSDGGTIGLDSAGTSSILIGENLGSAAAESLSGRLELRNPSDTTKYKHIIGQTCHWDNTGTSHLEMQSIGGSYNADTNAINGVQFLMSTGNIASGTVRLYGVTK
jgi:hypothetical protein